MPRGGQRILPHSSTSSFMFHSWTWSSMRVCLLVCLQPSSRQIASLVSQQSKAFWEWLSAHRIISSGLPCLLSALASRSEARGEVHGRGGARGEARQHREQPTLAGMSRRRQFVEFRPSISAKPLRSGILIPPTRLRAQGAARGTDLICFCKPFQLRNFT